MSLLKLFQYRLCLLGAAVLVSSQAAVLAADPVPSDRRLPPEVLLYLSSPDVPRSIEQFRNTAYGQLINDPALEEVRLQVVERFHEFSKEAEEKLEFPLSDLAGLLSGELSVAVVRPLGQPLGFVAFLDVGNQRDILERILAGADEELADRSAAKQTETIDGTEVTLYSIPKEDKPQAAPSTFAYFVRENIFVVGSTVSLLESVLTRWDGQHRATFADAEVYREIMDKCRSDADAKPAFIWYFNPVDLTTAALSTQQEYQMASVMFSAYLPTLGLDKLRALGGVVELATDEFDSVSRHMFYVTPPASGVLKVFEFRPSIAGPPGWVPEEATQFFAFDWNVAGAYQAIESIYDSFSGQPGGFERMLNQAAGPARGDLHLKNDVIDVLSGALDAYVIPAESGKPEETQGVLALGLTDEAKGLKLLKFALDEAGGYTTSESEGTTLYHISDGRRSGVLAIREQRIFLSESEQRLKQALGGKAERPLAESGKYRSIGAKVPDKVSIFTYQDASDQLKAGYEALRGGNLDSLTEGAFDFSVLPPFEALSKYFRPTAGYVVPDKNGALSVQFGLKVAE